MTSTDGILGRRGLRTGIEWSTPGAARARAAQLIAEHRARRSGRYVLYVRTEAAEVLLTAADARRDDA
ncbi:hypothetical protein ACFRAR_04060 [Kitasatospora sp. NPDC056651]|uniref:hypothetical protein n=1 Tax=Kitasatospora sp. NPDC056651 TaxID=3345892 RepID=UPI0036B958E4